MKNRIKTGIAFGESIRTEKIRHRNYFQSDSGYSPISLRGFMLPALLIFLLGLLFIKLIYLQFFQGSYYRNLANSNRIRTEVIHAPRGIIFDRSGKPLVYNVPGFREKGEGKTILLNQEQALSRIAGGKKLEIDSLRRYPYTDLAVAAIGYVAQISQEELQEPLFASYRPGDIVGKAGIEQQYEHILKGEDGRKLIEVDAMGKQARLLGKADPLPGQNITLTLDIALQQAAYKALEGIERGVVIASTPQGEILALVSKPSYDPNLFTMGKGYEPATDSAYKNVSEILQDSDKQPLLDRAIAGVYPPGSTFKLITAAAALEKKVIDEKYQIEDTGILKVGDFSFANWYFTEYGKTEGSVGVVKAIKRSNDIFFYKVAQLLGVEDLSFVARKFGLGKPLGIDLGGEAKGLVPDPGWKKKTLGEAWYLGDNYHYGIGQGYLLTTPLQVNMLTSVFANEGNLYVPYLLKTQNSKLKTQKFLSEKTISLIRQGMIESCAPGGVAWPLFEFKIKNKELRIDGKDILEVKPSTTSAGLKDIQEYRQIVVACKTGTAQHGGEKTLPHAWITLFAPAYKPQIVLTVLAESSGEGSNFAAPVAKKVLEEWFSR